MSERRPLRLIREVFHGPTSERRSTDGAWLEDMPADELIRARRAAVTARKAGAAEWTCAACGYPVYPSRHHLTGLRHFRHFAGAPDTCPWHHDDGFDLTELDTLRFGGHGEGVRHREVKRFLMHMTDIDPRFSPPDVPDYHPFKEHWVTGAEEQRRPDVYRRLHGHPIAFDVQLSRTYLRVIDGRETFYTTEGVRLVWVFWQFEEVRERLNSQDIYHVNRSNALSLDPEVVERSLETSRLHFRAWWWDHAASGEGATGRVWRDRIIDVDNLTWDPATGRPYYVDPEERRLAALVNGMAALWCQPDDNTRPWYSSDGDYDFDLRNQLSSTAFNALAEAVGCTVDWAWAERYYRFDRVLPLLYAVRDGRGYGGMNLAGTVMNLLENRRWATHAVVAVTRAYGRQEALDGRENAVRKVRRNIREAVQGVPDSVPLRQLDTMLAIIFPEAAKALAQPWPPQAALERLRAQQAL